ncbi:MAG: 30S ribosomal protein S14 [Bdellovibrionales bacterium]|jgi:small subunit ribosomal protein S14|nr:30S ribosomal protein S14 [Bdellovibrionales bacterium]
MATLGAVVKNNRRKKLAVKYAPIRKALRKKSLDTSLTEEERTEAFVRLQKLPRNGSSIRVRNRCVMTGRPRGNLRKFGLSRLSFRAMAHLGKIPGVTKASW